MKCSVFRVYSFCLPFLLVLAVCVDAPILDIEEILTNRTISAYDLVQEKRFTQARDVLNEVFFYAKMSNVPIAKTIYSSMRWSSWYHLRSTVNIKLGNSKAAVDDLDAACRILEGIPDVNINEVITCRYELVSLLVSYGDLDEALSMKSYLFELPLFGSDSWEYTNKKYSQMDTKSIVYLNNEIDRLLHVVSLFWTNQDRIAIDLKSISSSCENATFYCNLSEFAYNITQSCKHSNSCYEQVRESLSKLLPEAQFSLQREILYKIDIINSILSPVLQYENDSSNQGVSSQSFLTRLLHNDVVILIISSLILGYVGVILFSKLSLVPHKPASPVHVKSSSSEVDSHPVKPASVLPKQQQQPSRSGISSKHKHRPSRTEKVKNVSKEPKAVPSSTDNSAEIVKGTPLSSLPQPSKDLVSEPPTIHTTKPSLKKESLQMNPISEVTPEVTPIDSTPMVNPPIVETPIDVTPIFQPIIMEPATIEPPPHFDQYSIEFSMAFIPDVHAESYYILVKSLPSEIQFTHSERITIGNRTIMGWRLSDRDDHLSHSFDVNLNKTTDLSSHHTVDTLQSLTHFKYRYAIRIKRRYSFTWYLSCWLIRDLTESMNVSFSPDVVLPLDSPVFPYMPGSSATDSQMEPESEIIVRDGNSQMCDVICSGSENSPTPQMVHQRELSTLSIQSQATCISNQSEDSFADNHPIFPPGVPLAIPGNVASVPPGVPMEEIPLVTLSPPSGEGQVSYPVFIPNVSGVDENGMISTQGQPIPYQCYIPVYNPMMVPEGEGTEMGEGQPQFSGTFAQNEQGVYCYQPVDSNYLNNMGVVYFNPCCTVPTDNQETSTPCEDKD